MIKFNVDYSDGRYFATPLTDNEADKWEAKGHCIVSISEDKAQEWEDMMNKIKEWNSYWRELSNAWLKENYP